MLPLSFLWQIPTCKVSGLLRSHASPAHTFRQLMETARNRAEGLQHWGAGTSHCYTKPQGDRDNSAQCPLSLSLWVSILGKRTEFTVLNLGFLLLAAEMVRRGVWGQTPGRNVVLRPWCLGSRECPGEGTEGAGACLRGVHSQHPWAAFLGIPRGQHRAPFEWYVSHPISLWKLASGSFSPLPHGWNCSSHLQMSTILST